MKTNCENRQIRSLTHDNVKSVVTGGNLRVFWRRSVKTGTLPLESGAEFSHSVKPVRVQLSRAKGWRMPPNTVKVDRTTKWGNPFNFRDSSHCWTALAYGEKGNPAGRHAASVKAFRDWITSPAGMRIEGCGLYCGPVPLGVGPTVEAGQPPDPTELRGKNLACWCKPDQPCHADVLLELANAA